MKYFALTIGPIYRTLAAARKTRELWASSYIFSALMRELIAALENREIGRLLSPIVKDSNPKRHGAGIFPDRCFWKVDSKIEPKTINTIIKDAIDSLDKVLGEGYAEKLERQFRIYAATVHLNTDDTRSPILVLNNCLDALELQSKMPADDQKFIQILDANIQSLYKDGGQNQEKNPVFIEYESGRYRLPSLPEIASGELKSIDAVKYFNAITKPMNESARRGEQSTKDNPDQSIFDLKNKFGSELKFRHKYICFVKADGDKMGKTLESVGSDPVKIKMFSENLAAFAQTGVNEIIAFGGIPIYAGGDDLLFIVPVQIEKEGKQQHVFNLLKTLEDRFPSEVLAELLPEGDRENEKPTLSFGISIGYCKYPMAESLNEANAQLFEIAKKVHGKNAVAFRVLKHSGTSFGTDFKMSGNGYEHFKKILEACKKLDQSFLASVMHRLQKLPLLMEDALRNDSTLYFFQHHFNEDVHRKNEFDQYLTAVRKLAETSWVEQKYNIIKTLEQVFAALRFVQFLNQEDHD